jgi:hypothetical protein
MSRGLGTSSDSCSGRMPRIVSRQPTAGAPQRDRQSYPSPDNVLAASVKRTCERGYEDDLELTGLRNDKVRTPFPAAGPCVHPPSGPPRPALVYFRLDTSARAHAHNRAPDHHHLTSPCTCACMRRASLFT